MEERRSKAKVPAQGREMCSVRMVRGGGGVEEGRAQRERGGGGKKKVTRELQHRH